MADWGAKVTREGVDTASTDWRDYVLHSGFKSFKTQTPATSTIVLPNGGGSGTRDIAHGLGYAPMYFVFAEVNSNKWNSVDAMKNILLDGYPGFSVLIYAFSDATNLSLIATTTAALVGDYTINLKYYIIIDEKS